MNNPDLQPTLVGEQITLRPLQKEDFEALYIAASDPLVWEQHPDSRRYRRDVFEANFFAGAVASGSAFVVLDNYSGRIVGSTRFYEWWPDEQAIAIGYTFVERARWGGGANTEMKQLMLDHAFLFARDVWFHIGEENIRSRRAVEKLGAVYSHEEHRESKGLSFVQVYYKLSRPA